VRSLSLLQKATKADVRADPYPLLVLDNALPADLYNELAASFPSRLAMGVFRLGNNRRWDYPHNRARWNLLVPRLWRDFLAYHCSQPFFDEIVELFSGSIGEIYPNRFPTADSLRRLRVGALDIDSPMEKDVLLHTQISGNTPVSKARSVRTTHVDNGQKLFSALFYMRPDGYDAVGGDLTISRFKPQYAGSDKRSLFRGSYVNDDLVEVVETVGYDRNKLVLFINSLDSLHGVTVRHPTRHGRVFINLGGTVNPPLYTVPKEEKAARSAPSHRPASQHRA
jgi:hypothetical protein